MKESRAKTGIETGNHHQSDTALVAPERFYAELSALDLTEPRPQEFGERRKPVSGAMQVYQWYADQRQAQLLP